jgi:hypothetical protein
MSKDKSKSPDAYKGWFNPDEVEKIEEITQMNREEFFDISRQLEDCHSIFYKFWEVGKPYFTRTIPTAAVAFNPKDGTYISFVFNPDFWNWLDDYSRRFVIAHEMVHLILRHGLRIKDCKRTQLANVCLDLVVHRLLTNKFGFDRKKVKSADNLCWKDTVFDNNEHYKGPKVEDDKAFEYYYLLAKKHFPKPKRILQPGMIVWNKKTKDWGKVASVDAKEGKVDIEPMTKKEAIEACKENYKKALEAAKKAKNEMKKAMAGSTK